MKEIFMALAIVAVLFACGNFAEAKALTREHIDKVFNYLGQNPAISPENKATLNLDAAQLKASFNAELKPVLDKVQFSSDEERAVMEKLFYIENFESTEGTGGKIYMNFFGNSVAILGVTGKDDSNFKLLTCIYTMPETKNDDTMSSLILTGFVKSILPVANVGSFLSEVSAAQANGLTRDGVKFTLGRDGDLVVVTAVKG